MPRLALLGFLALAACATPIAPSGGPVDATPPQLVGSDPAEGATNVDADRLTLTFSERLAPTASRAVRVVPEGDRPLEVRVRGREIEVRLPDLRDSTTYVVTVGTELQDQRNVALRAPITLAFATGDAIDQASIRGVARDPATGRGMGGLAVWAYALADTLTAPDVRTLAPGYRTETASDGAFELAYLRPGPYYVIAVRDRNRNGRADAGEPFAAPPALALQAAKPDSSGVGAPPTFWTTAVDTLAPEPVRVRPLSDRRLAVRFGEPVRLTDADASAWTVADSTSGRAVGARPYQPADSPFQVALLTDAPLGAGRHLVRYAGEALADTAGNPVVPFTLAFTPSPEADTVRARVLSFLPDAPATDSARVVGRGVRPGVRLSSLPDDSTLVTATASGRPVPLVTRDGVDYRVASLDGTVALTATVGDSLRTQRYRPLRPDETGEIVGTVTGGGGDVLVEATPTGGPPVVVEADADGAFRVGGLAAGPVRLRLFADRNGNGRWDGGALVPFSPAEPLHLVAEPVTVRARWETEIDPIPLTP